MQTKGSNLRYLILLNLAMLFISTSGPLGKSLSIAPPLAIWYRSIIGFFVLFIYIKFRGLKFNLKSRKDYINIFFASVLMAIHWITYFFSLQYSNVAVAMLSLFTYPMITVFLEPIILKKKLDFYHVPIVVLLVIGIYFLIPEFDLSNNITLGVVFGLISAFTYSLRNIMLKNASIAYDGVVLMAMQALVATFILIPFLFIYDHSHLIMDWKAILALGVFTTGIGHSLFISTFRQFSISRVSILSSIQPLYGIILAFLFLGEIPQVNTAIGGVIIILLVVFESVRKSKK